MKTIRNILLILTTAILAFIGAIQTSWAKRFVKDYLVQKIEADYGYRLCIQEIEFSLPFQIKALQIQIFQKDQRLLDLQKLTCHLSPFELMHGSLILEKLSLESLALYELPNRQPVATESNSLALFSSAFKPFTIRIDNLQVRDFSLSPALYEYLQLNPDAFQPFPMDLAGNLAFNLAEQKASTNLLVRQTCSPQKQTRLTATGKKEANAFKLDLEIDEPIGGILTHPFNAPNKGNISLKLHLTHTSNRDIAGNLSLACKDSENIPPIALAGNFVAENIASSFRFEMPYLEARCGPIFTQGHFTIASSGNFENSALHIDIPDLAYLEKWLKIPAQGKIAADCLLSGNVVSPIVSIKTDSPGILLSSYFLENVSAELEGKYHGKGGQQFPFEISLHMDKADIVHLDAAHIKASCNLLLKGNQQEALLQGSIKTDYVEIALPEQNKALSKTVEITYINQSPAEKAPTIPVSPHVAFPIQLDLALDIPSHAYINKGKDLNSEWKGNLKINGTPSAPLVHGDLKVIKGDYRFNGKVFQIKEGSISFAGDPEKKTNLYVIGSMDLDKIIAEVILKGSLKNPALSFRSNPPLSQRDILSYILFNRGTSEITPFQGSQLSESITDLNSGNGGPDMLTKIRNRLGIDRIDISRGDNAESNEVSVKVGKYLSRGVLVSLNRSISEAANQVAIEAKLTDKIKVQAEVGDDAKGQLLLMWKHDY